MNESNPMGQDPLLRGLLRDAHPAPMLPPRFRENVWTRLERGASRAESRGVSAWIEAFVAGMLRPIFAAPALAAVLFAGVWLGFRDGELRVHRADQARYVASVSPFHRILP